ncbi:MAG: nucleotidyltransferase domain-containing protein [Nanoarchaeota archaeon]|nr:nucleotidyltransferase domain-containing protein [Nanoarchaeota archaeon]
MDVPKIFSTEERLKILRFVAYKTSPLNVNKVASELKISKGLVSKFFDILVKEDILKRTKNKFLMQDNKNVKAVKIMLNMESFDTRIFKKYIFVKSAGLYGSFIKGENTEESDIDLWVLIEKAKDEHLAKLTNELKTKYGNIKPVYLTIEKLKILKKEDTVFYYSLVFGSITVYGEKFESI